MIVGLLTLNDDLVIDGDTPSQDVNPIVITFLENFLLFSDNSARSNSASGSYPDTPYFRVGYGSNHGGG